MKKSPNCRDEPVLCLHITSSLSVPADVTQSCSQFTLVTLKFVMIV